MHTDPQPQGIPPQPLPTLTTVATAQAPGTSYVVLQVQTPQGISVFFLEPAHARDLAKHLTDHAQVAGSGLVIAGADAMPVNPETQP